jgi:tetratricopeptide (TPR) repeat protein
MSRKNKPRSHTARPAGPAGGSTTHEGQVRAALLAGRFKDAIEQYKALLKVERRPEWIAALAEAYAGRAGELAMKGMVKEAIALWRTRAEACGTPLLGGPYVEWLLRSGQSEQMFALLADPQALAPERREWLEKELAAAALVAPDASIARLPAEMPLVRHRCAAQAALAAATTNDEPALDEALKAIAFRSPYRDLRPLLRAMALLRTDRQQAAALLDRVAAGGPFERLAAALRVAVLPSHEWLAGLRGLDDAARALVFDLAGCPDAQRMLVAELPRANDVPALFDLLIQHRRAIPEAQARAFCLRLLPHAPKQSSAFRSAFGSLPNVERDRLLALAAEVGRDYDEAEHLWLSVVDQWRLDPATRRRAAMVLRHLASDRHYCRGEADSSPDSPALAWLERSLDLDPTDRESELRLLQGLRERGDLKATRQRLDAALARFAGDSAVLLEAVQTAIDGGAFKKAIGLAKQVLASDPINPHVRSVIGQAHLSHARKQIAARQTKAALRELDQARTWLRATGDLVIAGVLRAMATDAPADGDPMLRQALVDLGGTALAKFQIAHEATRVGFAAATVLRRAGADLNVAPGPAELAALAHALNSLRADDPAARHALEPLVPMLHQAASSAQCSESELAIVCEAMLRHRRTDLVLRFAAQALKRWPGRPIFVYFDVVARYGHEPRRMPARDCDRLEDAIELAQEQGDRRTTTRIAELLDRTEGFGGDIDEPFSPFDPGLGAAMEAMLALGKEHEFLELAKHALGRDEVERLRRVIGGSDKQFAQALLGILLELLPTSPATAPHRARRAQQPRAQAADGRQRGLFDD